MDQHLNQHFIAKNFFKQIVLGDCFLRTIFNLIFLDHNYAIMTVIKIKSFVSFIVILITLGLVRRLSLICDIGGGFNLARARLG